MFIDDETEAGRGEATWSRSTELSGVESRTEVCYAMTSVLHPILGFCNSRTLPKNERIWRKNLCPVALPPLSYTDGSLTRETRLSVFWMTLGVHCLRAKKSHHQPQLVISSFWQVLSSLLLCVFLLDTTSLEEKSSCLPGPQVHLAGVQVETADRRPLDLFPWSRTLRNITSYHLFNPFLGSRYADSWLS